MVTATLVCHPASRCPHITHFSATMESLEGQRVALRMRIEGAIDELLLPARAVSKRSHELWTHTCFEAFLRGEGPGYYEFNVSPSGEWAAYRFTDYRNGMSEATVLPPRIDSHHTSTRLDVDMEFSLPAELAAQNQPLVASLTAVIEDRNAQITYWAVTHAGAKPDFHHRDSFILSLPKPAAV